jgi:hypothetical protein
VPYEAARDLSLTGADLAGMSGAGGVPGWVASRSRDWLEFWRREIGREGFYPFDLLAAAYVIEPRLFDCAPAAGWVSEDDELWELFHSPEALLVGLEDARPSDALASAPVVYCPRIGPGLHAWLARRLGG